MTLKKANDHRLVGPRQSLFFMHELTLALPFSYRTAPDLTARGSLTVLGGYQEVVSPNIYSTDLWKISGHYYKYREYVFVSPKTRIIRNEAYELPWALPYVSSSSGRSELQAVAHPYG